MLAVGAIVARAAPWRNRFAARLQRALLEGLQHAAQGSGPDGAPAPRPAEVAVTLVTTANPRRAPLPDGTALVVNLSPRETRAWRPWLPPTSWTVDFHYHEGSAVSLSLAQLWRRPAFVPGRRAVLAPPATLALSARLLDAAGRPVGSAGRWEGRAHRKRATRAVDAMVHGAPLLLADLLGHLRAGRPVAEYPALGSSDARLPARCAGGALATALRYGAHLVRDTVRGRWHPDEVEQWGIGLAPAAGMDPDPQAIRWIYPPDDRGFADPFLVRWEGIPWLFFEEIPHATAHGVLAAMPVDADGRAEAADRRPVLRYPHHLSFPTLHAVDGTLYLLCEEGAAGVVRLHRCVRFPDRWEPLPPLVPGLAGADPVLWAHAGHWYLFVADARGGNHDNHLQLFVADAITGPYRRHPASPLRFGLHGSRMAGAILEAPGGPYRLGQDCTARYGGAVGVFAIDEATPDRYRERFVRALDPIPGSPYPLGRHTHAALDGLVALDGLRLVPSGRAVSPAPPPSPRSPPSPAPPSGR